jgi:hypothetical protein
VGNHDPPRDEAQTVTAPTAEIMLAAYEGQLLRVKQGYGYGFGLARDREVERLSTIVAALALLVVERVS